MRIKLSQGDKLAQMIWKSSRHCLDDSLTGSVINECSIKLRTQITFDDVMDSLYWGYRSNLLRGMKNNS